MSIIIEYIGENKMKRNKGISLIVLVITIIVIIILAGSVILSLSQNNPIEQSQQATFKTNVESYNSELSLAISTQYLNKNTFNPVTFNAGTWDGTAGDINGSVKQYITSITDQDGKKFEIQRGKLVYVGNVVLEQSYITSMGLINVIKSGLFLKVYTGITGLSCKLGGTYDASGVITLPAIANSIASCQYGPYQNLEEGIYQITITGENLNYATLNTYYGSGVYESIINVNRTSITNTSTTCVYNITLPQFTHVYETVIYNYSNFIIKVNNIEIKQLS